MAAVRMIQTLVLILLAITVEGCAANRKATNGYSRPTADTGDRDFFIGSFLSDGGN
jgi:hypothetical protein